MRINLFDTTGTLVGVATRANLLDENGEAENLDKALKADSGASIFGTFFGCSDQFFHVDLLTFFSGFLAFLEADLMSCHLTQIVSDFCYWKSPKIY